jgi:hypothetical protein
MPSLSSNSTPFVSREIPLSAALNPPPMMNYSVNNNGLSPPTLETSSLHIPSRSNNPYASSPPIIINPTLLHNKYPPQLQQPEFSPPQTRVKFEEEQFYIMPQRQSHYYELEGVDPHFSMQLHKEIMEFEVRKEGNFFFFWKFNALSSDTLFRCMFVAFVFEKFNVLNHFNMQGWVNVLVERKRADYEDASLKITNLTLKLWPSAKVETFGSVATNLAIPSSV